MWYSLHALAIVSINPQKLDFPNAKALYNLLNKEGTPPGHNPQTRKRGGER
jgi:hypothetical protein